MLFTIFKNARAKNKLFFNSFHALSNPNQIAPELKNSVPSPEEIDKLPSPRVVKSHLPFYLLHPELLYTSKVVYVARNPKDVMVSYYFHHKLIKWPGFTGNMEEFVEYFMQDEGTINYLF